MAKLDKFIEHLKWHTNKSIYVWGGQGELLSDLTEQDIRAMETSKANANLAVSMWEKRKKINGARAFDCSGLGCYLLETVGAVAKGFDTTAQGLKAKCDKISKNDLQVGDFVFKCYAITNKAYHIGYYIGDGKVVEAQGRAYGVVCRPLSEGGWNYYGRPHYWDDEKFVITRNLKVTEPTLMEGEDVVYIQKALRNRGYEITTLTGKYGKQTQQRIREFQKANGLTVDGICGKKTVEKLGGVFK